jgi:hypothetical protein
MLGASVTSGGLERVRDSEVVTVLGLLSFLPIVGVLVWIVVEV